MKYFIAVILNISLIFSHFPLFAGESLLSGKNAKTENSFFDKKNAQKKQDGLELNGEFRNFLFEIAKNVILQQADGEIFEISRPAVQFLLLPLWKNSTFSYLYEVFFPEKAGEINFQAIKKFEDKAESDDDASENFDLLSVLDGKSDGEKKNADIEAVLNRLHDGKLRKISYGNEKTSVFEKDGFTVLLNADEKTAVRRTFDSNFHLVKKETFSSPQNFEKFSAVSETNYFYSDDGKLLKTEAENFSKKTRVLKTYRDDGKIEGETKVHFEEENPQTKSIYVKDSEKKWEYDEKGRIEKIILTEYFPAKNKKTEKKEHITRFEYVFEQTPDTYFYEDGKLRIKTVYDNSTDFTKTFFFDGGFSVVGKYIAGEKVSETTYLDGRSLRRLKK